MQAPGRRDKGTNSCFTDTTFVFDTIIPEEHLNADKTVKEALDAAAKETDYLMQDAGYY